MISQRDIQRAVDVLERGGIVLFSTETSYGLAADAGNPRAVAKVAALKGRPKEKAFPLIAADFAMASAAAELSPRLRRLAREFWPGPLTIVAPRARRKGTVAIRVSSHPAARALARALGRPIVSTSANRSGEKECFSVPAFRRQFAASRLQPDLILDAGALPRRKPSTIVAEEGGKLVVLRRGPVRISKSHAA